MVPTWEGPVTRTTEAFAAHRRRNTTPAGWIVAIGGLVPLFIVSAIYLAVRAPIHQVRRPAPFEASRPVHIGAPLEASRQGLLPTPQGTQVASTAEQSAGRPAGVPGKFTVSFGRFANRKVAEAHARKIRVKGYQVSIVPVGSSFHVVSRAYQDRTIAQFWSQVFQQIGLRTRVIALTELSLTILRRG